MRPIPPNKIFSQFLEMYGETDDLAVAMNNSMIFVKKIGGKK